MAEEENAEAQAAEGDSPVQKKGDGGDAKPGGPNQKLVYLVLGIQTAVILALAVMFWMYVSKGSKTTSHGDIEEQLRKEGTHATDGGDGQGGTEKKVEAEDRFIQESFTVNLADPRGSYFAKVDVVIEVEDDFVKTEVNKLRPKIRDFILVVLSSKTYEQVESLDGRNFLREEIRNKINGYLPRGEVKNVYFTQFIIQ